MAKVSKISKPKDEFYQTPDYVTKTLLKHITIPEDVMLWEPFCGKGAISRLLPEGRTLSTDLYDRGFGIGNADFLKIDKNPFGDRRTWIITNPPFSLADKSIRHAWNLGIEKVIFLMPFSYCAGVRRTDIIESGRLEKVLLFKDRFTMYPDYIKEEEKGGESTINFGWFIFGEKTDNKWFIVKRVSIKEGKEDV